MVAAYAMVFLSYLSETQYLGTGNPRMQQHDHNELVRMAVIFPLDFTALQHAELYTGMRAL